MVTEVRGESIAAVESERMLTRFEQFVELAVYQRDNKLPQNADPYTRAYERSFANHLEKNDAFRQVFGDLLNDMPDIEPSNLMRRTLKTFQHLELSANPDVFPRNRSMVKEWDGSMQRLLTDEDYRDQFYGNIFLPIMSNVSERGVLLKAVVYLHGLREAGRVLDMGCSQNYVLKRLALEGRPDLPDLAYNQVAVMGRKGRKAVLDPLLTHRLSVLLNRAPLELGPSVGIDIMPFDRDGRLTARAMSDSLYMGELVMDKLTRQRHILAHERVKNVSFVNADAETVTPDEIGGGNFDISYISTMLYQMPRETVKTIIANAERATHDDGIIVVQDFVRRMNPSGSLQFYKHWPPYTYGLWVKDKTRPDLGFQKYFSVYSGRVENIIPHPALGRLPVGVALGLAPDIREDRDSS